MNPKPRARLWDPKEIADTSLNVDRLNNELVHVVRRAIQNAASVRKQMPPDDLNQPSPHPILMRDRVVVLTDFSVQILVVETFRVSRVAPPLTPTLDAVPPPDWTALVHNRDDDTATVRDASQRILNEIVVDGKRRRKVGAKPVPLRKVRDLPV